MSVPRSMHSIQITPTGRGIPRTINAKKGVISGTLLAKVYAMLDLRLSNIRRPSSMPVTIVAKLSSSSIKSATCLLTSDPDNHNHSRSPVMPIAIPMSAFLRAGESLTPSPVTAVIRCNRWQLSTICNFCTGDVLANTIS
ncbi:hypothetical protein ALC62_06051 [Cyphomyrmex costatus]|uniref:Uncharacterized protein n=1 Tax=Cyphomyrmex costatus TaxID=456900 RepID=A0A195CST7_9HYME|nr:hypothetical protein ALC62_06051 [Cyphomyrmex costatus]